MVETLIMNPTYFLPPGINPPCTCDGHGHVADEAGLCVKPVDNDPSSFGFCPCQHSSTSPVTTSKYEQWQRDINAGKIGPDDSPGELGLTY